MTNEEFEEIFGNVPFKDIAKIQKYIQEKIENKDREIEKLEKQSKAIDRQAQQYFEQTIYLNKIIDLMADFIGKYHCFSVNVFDINNECTHEHDCKDCIKQYFVEKEESYDK